MNFLAPWALALGALGAAGVVILHLVARQRPAAYLLPTTRFIPDRRTLVSRAATRPRDLLLLALRVLVMLAAGAAFARPVLTPSRGTMARIVLLDRSRAVGDAAEVVRAVKALSTDGIPTTVIAFDSIPSVVNTAALDSLAAVPVSAGRGSLTAALISARRVSRALVERADSVQLVIVSPLAASEFDSATSRMRGLWPGALLIKRVSLRTDSAATWQLERRLAPSDQLGPALVSVNGSHLTRLVRAAPTPDDSSFARKGGTVVRWDSSAAIRPAAEGLVVGDDVIVASLARRAITTNGDAIARWSDGTPAATQASVGAGCMREVGVALPSAGDIALHARFQQVARGLLAPCGLTVAEHAADSSTVSSFVGAMREAAGGAALRDANTRTSPLVPWLLGFALLCAIGELFVRMRSVPEAA